jgi:hypothetical protein
VVLRVYLDESGVHDGSPIVTVAGYIGRPKEWRAWTSRWVRTLRPIKVYHAACPGNSRCQRGIGDVTTGCVAVAVAALLAQNAIGARKAVYMWSLFGIADLVVAIAMGAMTSPGRAHLLALEAPNLLISSYPLA